MKKTRLMSAFLATAVLSGVIGAVPVIAEEDTVLYTYQNEQGETVNITQSEIDAGHWNVDALGDTLPIVYEDFPVEVNSFVNDFAELKLKLQYLKNLEKEDCVYITIENLQNGNIVYETDLTSEVIYTDILDINMQYKLTLTETISDDTKEYKKLIKTTNSIADMPDYIIDGSETECSVLIADISDLKASEVVDENGDIGIDGSMPRYTKVSAQNYVEYVSNLPSNAVYRIYTKDEAGIAYTGYFNKNTDGEISEIYIPEITISSWTDDYAIAPATLPSDDYITATRIVNAAKIEMNDCRDYSYSYSSSYFKVFAYQVDDESELNGINWVLKASDSIGVQVWNATSLTATPVHCYTKVGTNGRINISALPSLYAASEGEYLFFVVYFTDTMEGTGVISTISLNRYPSEDVTNFTYEAYENGGSRTLSKTTYTLYDDRDVDAFYVNYTDATQTTIKAYLYNNVESENLTEKCMEIAYYSNQDTFMTTAFPDDIITVTAGSYKYYRFVAGETMQAFICIYNSDGVITSNQSDYAIKYS